MPERGKVSAAERRERAAVEAEDLVRQERRTRGALVIGAVALLVLIVVATLVIWRGSQASYLDDVARAPQGSDSSGGIPVAADGTAGTAGSGPRLDVYVDVQSPASVLFWQTQGADLRALNADGTISLWLHLVGFVDGGTNGFSTRGAQAAVVVADRAPEAFLDFVDAAFAHRAGGADKLNDPDLEMLALQSGVAQVVADKFDDNLFNAWCVAATEQAAHEGVADTPTLLLDGDRLTADWTVEGALADAVG